MIQGSHFEILYTTHRGALVVYAGRLLGDSGRAEEVVQEAYMRFAASAGARPIDQPLAYLYRTVQNLCLDTQRSLGREQRRNRLLAEALAELETLRGAVATPEAEAASRQELMRLSEAMGELPARMRRALELHRFAGLTVKQVGEELQVSTGTAHALIVEALERCRKRLER